MWDNRTATSWTIFNTAAVAGKCHVHFFWFSWLLFWTILFIIICIRCSIFLSFGALAQLAPCEPEKNTGRHDRHSHGLLTHCPRHCSSQAIRSASCKREDRIQVASANDEPPRRWQRMSSTSAEVTLSVFDIWQVIRNCKIAPFGKINTLSAYYSIRLVDSTITILVFTLLCKRTFHFCTIKPLFPTIIVPFLDCARFESLPLIYCKFAWLPVI